MTTFARRITEAREVWPEVIREGWFLRKGWKAALVLAAFLLVAIAAWWAWQDVQYKHLHYITQRYG